MATASASVSEQLKIQVQNLLADAIMVLCKNTLMFHTELCVEGLLGITLDHNDVLLINIKEILDRSMLGRDINTTCKQCSGRGRVVMMPQPLLMQPPTSLASLQQQQQEQQQQQQQQHLQQQPLSQPISMGGDISGHGHSAGKLSNILHIPEIEGQSSGDEVAATVVKKPRISRKDMDIAQQVTVTQVAPPVASTTVAPRVKMEPKREIMSSGSSDDRPWFTPAVHSQRVVISEPITVESENPELKRTLSRETDPVILSVEPTTSMHSIARSMPQQVMLVNKPPETGGLDSEAGRQEPTLPASDLHQPSLMGENLYSLLGDRDPDISLVGVHNEGPDMGIDLYQQTPGSSPVESNPAHHSHFSNSVTGTGMLSDLSDMNPASMLLDSIEISPKGCDDSLDGGGGGGGKADRNVIVVDDESSQAVSEAGNELIKLNPPCSLPEEEIVRLEEVAPVPSSLSYNTPTGGIVFPSFSSSHTPPMHSVCSTVDLAALAPSPPPTSNVPIGSTTIATPTTVITPTKCKITAFPATQSSQEVMSPVAQKPLTLKKAKPQVVHPCWECGKVFRQSAAKARHARMHAETANQCHLCDRKFYRKEFLDKHMEKRHGPEADTDVVTSIMPAESADKIIIKMENKPHSTIKQGGKPLTRVLSKGKVVYPCRDCGKVFKHAASKVRHARVHIDNFCTCKLCNRKFYRRDVLNKHMINKHSKETAGMEEIQKEVVPGEESDDEMEESATTEEQVSEEK